MRTSYQLTPQQTLVPRLVPNNVPHALDVGDVLHLEDAFTTPYGEVPAGIICYVEAVAEEDGLLELHVPQYVAALEPWGRRILLWPFNTDAAHLFRLVHKAGKARPAPIDERKVAWR